MFGVALEGGGAKGAFHMGAVKALLEHGYQIDGAVGTSIGAFNAALISQGDFDAAYEFWMGVQPSDLFDIDNGHMKKLLYSEYDLQTIKYFSAKTWKILGNKGISIDRLRATVERLVSEEKLRNSDKEYGLVTVSLSEFKPVELYKEEIPEGKLTDFILASANLPVFRSEGIDEKKYLDGGVYNNCPLNLLIDKGFDEVFAIRTAVRDKMRNVSNPSAKIVNVTPSEDLGSLLVFDQDLIQRNIKLGYYDTLRHIKGLKGRKYYIEPQEESMFVELLNAVPEEVILAVGTVVKAPEMDSKRMLFERILPTVSNLLHLPITASYQDLVIALLEEIAREQGVDKFRVYTWNEFIEKIDEKVALNAKKQPDARNGHLAKIKKMAMGRWSKGLLEEIAYVVLEQIPLSSIRL